MASINRLAIRGVRSFSPNDEEQALEFFFPCTVIVGSNGCGKTTIIESLKYAMTGSFPPGNKSGQAFVHDPRSIGSSVVKAQVKLRFTSKGGKQMVVIRSMELTQKKTTMAFKQLDGALRTLNTESGKIVSLSHKCTELDRQLPALLGVSKAILENVLFCHQEDASWPLQEGAVLKKRFDDIFDSTRYTKAIDVFRKTEKELLSKAKDYKADVAGLASHKHAAQNFKRDLNRHKEQRDHLDDDKKKLADDIKQAEKQEADAEEIIDKIDTVNDDIEQAQHQLQAKHDMLAKQKQMLSEDMTGENKTVEALTEKLRDFDQQVSTHEQDYEDTKNKDKSLEREIMALHRQERSFSDEKTRLLSAKEQQQQRCKERFDAMERMAKAFALDLQLSSQNVSIVDTSFSQITAGTASNAGGGEVPAVTDEDMENFFRITNEKEKELKELYQQTQSQHQAEEDKLVAELADLEARLKSAQSERQKLMSEREKANQELRDINQQHGGPMRVRKSDIDGLRGQLEQLGKQRDDLTGNPKRTSIPVQIRKLEEKIDAAKRDIEDDRLCLETLRHSAENQNAIAMLEDQAQKEWESFVEGYNEQNFVLQKHNLLPTDDVRKQDGQELVSFIESLYDEVRTKHESVKSDLTKAEDRVSKTQRSVNERSAVAATQEHSLASAKARLEQLESGSVQQMRKLLDKIRQGEASIGSEPPRKDIAPRDLMQFIDKRLKDFEEDSFSDTATAKKVLKKLKRMGKIKDPTESLGVRFECPCCVRVMSDRESIVAFNDRMDDLIKNSPFVKEGGAEEEEHNRLKSKYESWRRTLNSIMDDLLDYKRLREETKLTEVRISEIEEEMGKFQATLAEDKQAAKEVQGEVDELQDVLRTVEKWSADVSRIAEKRGLIAQKQNDLSLDTDHSGRDLRKVESDIAEKTEAKDQHMDSINRLNKEMTTYNNKLSQISQQISNIDRSMREKEMKYAAYEKAQEKKNALTLELKRIAEADQRLQEDIPPLNRKVSTKSRDKDRARSLKQSETSAKQNALLDFQSEAKELRRLHKAVNDFQASGGVDDIERVDGQIQAVTEEIRAKFQEQKELRQELEKLKSQVSDSDRYKKLIRDNIGVLETQKACSDLNELIDQLQTQRDAIDGHDTAYDDLSKARAVKQEKQDNLARLEGRYMEVVEAIRSSTRKLSAEEYKNVDEQYRKAHIKLVTTQTAAEDLKKYWTAVDKALLKYHSVKIQEINKIVRELWLLTYKGEDIGNIMIVSGQEAGSRSTRSYNYRVVMSKGNSELDMRGRCSAGQRVLASIVIRLALAETFGVNCGCIALDEPTVNLDHANKKGLAIALAQIIASRAQQSNFQIILITHDEEFVAMVKTEMSLLTGFSMPEKYFQVHRERASDGKFYSKIDERDWSELV